MAMSAGGEGGGLTNDINVTPMIDVLLVLLVSRDGAGSRVLWTASKSHMARTMETIEGTA